MTSVAKWALGVGVIVLIAIAAIVPLTTRSPAPQPVGSAVTSVQGQAPVCPDTTPRPTDSPAPTPDPWDKVSTRCLGAEHEISLSDVFSDRPTLVNVWATWCPPCRQELPILADYARQPDAIPVLTVQVASSMSDGISMLNQLGVQLPTLHDGDGQQGPIREALKVPPFLPASYLVNKPGDAKLITNPRLFTSVDQVRAAVAGAND